MQDSDKTKEQLINELVVMRQITNLALTQNLDLDTALETLRKAEEGTANWNHRTGLGLPGCTQEFQDWVQLPQRTETRSRNQTSKDRN